MQSVASLSGSVRDEKDLLEAISDEHCRSILRAVDQSPKSVAQLSSECGIFSGIVYRRIKLLQRCGLLDTFYEIRPDGKKFYLYKSLVRKINVSFAGSRLQVSVSLKDDRSAPEGDGPAGGREEP